MKFLHLADLHIGKRVHEASMIDEQRRILATIVDSARTESVDAVLIAGDVFDRMVPSTEALGVCQQFFSSLLKIHVPIFCIAGNHDSADRLSFCSPFMEDQGIHIAPPYTGTISTYCFHDQEGDVLIHLLPFIKATDARMAFPQEADDIHTVNDAVRIALAHHPIDTSKRNILLSHQFVIDGSENPTTCDSETISVGGIDGVQASLFDEYSYVALGHIHSHQQVRRPEVRYCGTPLAYSFSECSRPKTLSIVNIDGQDHVTIREQELHPHHTMREIKTSFEQISKGCDTLPHDDYVHVTLTDEALFDAAERVRAFYPNMLRLDFASQVYASADDTAQPVKPDRSPLQLFDDFYRNQTGKDLTEAQAALVQQTIETTREAKE
ncbi:MAG: exonuclease SbcCD subunit D [Eggerthellaceae bacterium]|jgi:exonuclease SbcD|nr:exonuclease SbcCD subunit D [Eggerthellaceae bacterium]MCH4221693.1 exonuclease SbcCD subunit D [Eggerthellaceae bacterium]